MVGWRGEPRAPSSSSSLPVLTKPARLQLFQVVRGHVQVLFHPVAVDGDRRLLADVRVPRAVERGQVVGQHGAVGREHDVARLDDAGGGRFGVEGRDEDDFGDAADVAARGDGGGRRVRGQFEVAHGVAYRHERVHQAGVAAGDGVAREQRLKNVENVVDGHDPRRRRVASVVDGDDLALGIPNGGARGAAAGIGGGINVDRRARARCVGQHAHVRHHAFNRGKHIPSLLPMMSTGSPAATVDELPRVTAVGRAAVADGSNLSTAKSWDTS